MKGPTAIVSTAAALLSYLSATDAGAQTADNKKDDGQETTQTIETVQSIRQNGYEPAAYAVPDYESPILVGDHYGHEMQNYR